MISLAIPRMKLRQKTAFETVSPLIVELEGIIPLAGARSTREESRALIFGVSHLANRVVSWVKTRVDVKESEILACNVYI
jgi:hypothetical protein